MSKLQFVSLSKWQVTLGVEHARDIAHRLATNSYWRHDSVEKCRLQDPSSSRYFLVSVDDNGDVEVLWEVGIG